MKNLTEFMPGRLAAVFTFCFLMTFTLQAESAKPCKDCAVTPITLLSRKCTNEGAECGRNGTCKTLIKYAGLIKYKDCFCVQKAEVEGNVQITDDKENAVVTAGMSTDSRSWMLLTLFIVLGISFQYRSRRETSML